MAIKKFMDLAVGEKFNLANAQGTSTEYIKTNEQRVSCCKVFNATLASDNQQNIQVLPLIEVEVKD